MFSYRCKAGCKKTSTHTIPKEEAISGKWNVPKVTE